MKDCSLLKIKALLGMLARLPWGRRDMLGSMNGKHGGVPLDKSIHYCMIVKDNGKGQVTCQNVSVSRESVFKMLKNNICNTGFEVGQAFREL